MIYIAAVYVFICAIQCAFMIWRDLNEASRRANLDKQTKENIKRMEATEERATAAIEGFREEIKRIVK